MNTAFARASLAAALLFAATGCVSAPKSTYVSPIEGRVISGYGPGEKAFHHGLDFTAEVNAPVKSVMDGVVIFRGRSKSYGRMLVVDHGAGVRSYYGNLGGFKARRGQTVKRGEKIARAGRTKDNTGYLHFELRIKKKSVDPKGIVPVKHGQVKIVDQAS